MPSYLEIDAFLQSEEPILDVRSPGEYEQGHIPGAFSFPLFSNEERHEIGTLYKQQGREPAIDRGLELIGPRMLSLVQQARELGQAQSGRVTYRVHCWRGGMRSSSVSWLLETAGMKVKMLRGGYKAWRRWALRQFEASHPLVLIGGMTGSGKTLLLHALQEAGEQVLDLEGIANHMGSAFGAIGQAPQPTSEQFSNNVAKALGDFDPQRPIWVEAESRKIGFCHIPSDLFNHMKRSALIAIQRTEDERLDVLEQMYSEGSGVQLEQAIEAIRDKLGGKRTQETLALLQSGDFRSAAGHVLKYYDSTYQYGLSKRDNPPLHIDLKGQSWQEAARSVVRFWKQQPLD